MSAPVRVQQVFRVLPEGEVIGAEIGVWKGFMSKGLLQRENLSLYMVDNWKPVAGLENRGYSESAQQDNRVLAWAETDFASERRVVLEMDSVKAARFVPDGFLDFVFIDGDHSYVGVRTDIDAWLPKLKRKAWLCGHDYANPNEKCGEEVKRAVDECAATLGAEVFGGEDHTWFIKVP